jgi:hypothetical protein
LFFFFCFPFFFFFFPFLFSFFNFVFSFCGVFYLNFQFLVFFSFCILC